MKKIKLLLAVVAVIALLSTAVFAAEGTILDLDDASAVLNGDRVSIKINCVETLFITGGSTFSVSFDPNVWEYVDYEHGSAYPKNEVDPTEANNGSIWPSIDPTAFTGLNITKGDHIGTVTLKLKDGKTVADDTTGISIATAESAFMNGTTYEGYYPSDTVFVTGGKLERPTNGVATTFTASNGTTYTNVPNATVSVTIPAGGVTGGNILATYWKNGFTALKTATIPFTTGDVKITGENGATASFDVAITGVPTTVVITKIGIAFN